MTYYDFALSRETLSREASSRESCLEEEPGTTESHAIARFERVLRMIRMLQDGNAYTSGELSDELNVAQRTIFRDIKMLRDCGVPIDSGPRGRGYCLEGDIFSRPTPPTSSDIAVMVLGVHLARSMEAPGIERLLGGALTRLVGPPEGDINDCLARFDRMFDIVDVASIGSLSEINWLPRLLARMQQGKLIRICVPSLLADGNSDCIHLFPQQLKIANQTWWLIGRNQDGREVGPFDLRSITVFETVHVSTVA